MDKKSCRTRDPKKYHTGFDDNLDPVVPIDISKIDDFDEMLGAMKDTALGGRTLGEAGEVLYNMITDKDAFTVLTLSGAMTPAGMMLLICEMIDRGLIQAIVSTGALMTHGFVASSGMAHFKYDTRMSDEELYNKGYNRIYDVLEPEKNLDDTEKAVDTVLDYLNPDTTLYSRLICKELGRWLAMNVKERGLLKSAYQMNIPIYIPAFTDSELGLDMALYNRRRAVENQSRFNFNPFIDLEHFTELINQQKKLGIFTIGGGVPRNWSQQVAPYLELIRGRMPEEKVPEHISGKIFSYGVRICPAFTQWGGLSGCTYSEGISWGKMNPNGQFAEVLSDATFVWPLLIKGVIQRIEKNNIWIGKNFNLSEQIEIAEKYTKQIYPKG